MYLISNHNFTRLYSCRPDYKDAYNEYTFYKLFLKTGDHLECYRTGMKIYQPGLIESKGDISAETDELGYKIISGDCLYGYASYPLIPPKAWCFPIKVLKKDIIAVEESIYDSRSPGKVAFFQYRITYQAWSVVFKKGIMVWCNQKP